MTEMKIPKDVVYGILKVPIPVRRSQIRKTINKGSGDPNLAWHIDGCDKRTVALQGCIDSLVIQGMNMGGEGTIKDNVMEYVVMTTATCC